MKISEFVGDLSILYMEISLNNFSQNIRGAHSRNSYIFDVFTGDIRRGRFFRDKYVHEFFSAKFVTRWVVDE